MGGSLGCPHDVVGAAMRRAPRACQTPECPGLSYTIAPRCERCEAEHEAKNGTTARLRKIPNSGARGYGHAWRKIRAEHLRKFPECVYCGEPADRVDHIDNDQTNNDESNLASCCVGCHGRKSVAVDGVFRSRRWKRGNA